MILQKIINVAKNDSFTQKWLSGNRFKVNSIIAFLILTVAMNLSLKLLADYDNWSLMSVFLQYIFLLSPLPIIISYSTLNNLKNKLIRRISISFLTTIGVFGFFIVNAIMGLLSRGYEHTDPYASILFLYVIMFLIHLTRLALLAGKQYNIN